ncbi:MAG TPA: hypothetical protein VE621_01850 [Bryobacteraceae bacterium]|nr:hypothetical protein [Bryobacteraceae bacterium]
MNTGRIRFLCRLRKAVTGRREQLRVRVVEQDTKPRQLLRSAYEGDLPHIDMSREINPRAAIEVWMTDQPNLFSTQQEVEQEILDSPGRFHFLEMLSPLPSGQIQWIVRAGRR